MKKTDETKTAPGASANHAIGKVLQLISFMAGNKSPMRLLDLSTGTGIPQATVLRYLNLLSEEGYVYQDLISGRYALTWKLANLGAMIRSHLSLRSISGDIVTLLYETLSLGICLVIEHDLECMYLDCLYVPDEMGISVARIGRQTPLHATSSGKMLLTQFSEDEIDHLIRQKGLADLTPKTITDKETLMKELDKVRRQGYSMDDEECEEGLRCVAVPIYGQDGKIAAALSAFGSLSRVTYDSIEKTVLPKLRESARQISFRIGGRKPD
ncbi:MAG TPA: IclR family transcriptional regulator [Candidatus Choladousia intestinavium]|uniref:IclR family transcriptional regulator n=1 Tax=Candidatus Choladousia intestinavium TaxID=2840727 RepID=A0A9D1ADU2_9FIRM|nr:IclR family transcriptional regulator [Candidatus Choladousia intestinavium]